MSVLSILLAASIKGSVLLALAWFVTGVAMRRASAAARHLVWVSAIGGILVLPFISAIVPALPVRGLEVPVVAAPVLAPSPSITVTPSPASADIGSPAAPVPVLHEMSGARGSASVSTREAPSWRSIVTREGLLAIIGYLWLIGAALMLLRVALGTFRVSQWTRRAHPVGEGDWLALVRRLARSLRIARPITLLRSERACVPMTWGVVYPTVLLPIDANDWSAERRTIVLLHELAHVKRLDAFTQFVAQLAIGVFWFNPLVWIAARAMRAERERACDDFVLQAGARASAYAHDLLEIARLLGSSSAPAVAALAMARRGELEGRLLAILDPKTDRRNVTRARLALVTVAVWTLVLPLAALAPAPDTSRKIETPTTATPAPEKAAAVEKSKQPAPDRETLIAVARAARKLTSSYDKAELLITIVEHYIRDDELRTAYLDAVASLTSDYDRTRTLIPLLLKDSLTSDGVAQVVKIAGSMSSSNDKANILVRVATEHPSADLIGLINAASGISSSYDKARSLIAIASRYPLTDSDVRRAFFRAAEAISSPADYRRVITSVLK